MARLTSGTLHSFSSTTPDSVRYRPSTSARSEHFLLISGEVVNPVVLESFVVEHPMVHSAIMFGHARYNAGILIELEDRFKIDTSEPKQVEEIKNKLQVVIDRMNMSAPQHARVQKEMVLFASPTKPFIYTRLSSARFNRRDTLAAYNGEINAIYNSIARAALIALKPPKIWGPKNALVYVRDVVFAVLAKEIDDDDDLFDHGMDSVRATRIRVILFHALQSTVKTDTRSFSGNVVYQNPTITCLAAFAARTAQACLRHRTESSQIRSLEMTRMVKNYITSFPQHRPSMPLPSEDVVLITGTTGLFGLNLLAELLHSVRVTKVYALNRRKSRPGAVAERHATLLNASGLDPALVRHPKLILLEADASHARLGLPQDVYEEMRSSVTHVVHNAWPSTSNDKPAGVFDDTYHTLRNLVDVALSSPHLSPPRFLFISSTETVRGQESASSRSSLTKTTSALGGPVGDAYTESKWIGEQILAAAASSTALRPIVVRLGPLCATPNGRWRDTSYLPTIVRLGKALGTLPRINEVVHWLPVRDAARAVADMRNASTPVCHVTHPHPVSSLSLLHLISTELRLPIVPLAHWTAKLEGRVHATLPSADASSGHDPALALLRHIWRTQDPMAIDTPTRIFGHAAKSVGGYGSVNAPSLGIDDVKLWIQYWKETGVV